MIPMVTLVELRTALEGWTYKPGATFTAHPTEGFGHIVTLDIPVMDARNGPRQPLGETWTSLRTNSVWAPYLTLDFLPEFLWRLVRQAEEHEAGEWLVTPDGRKPYDPHQE